MKLKVLFRFFPFSDILTKAVETIMERIEPHGKPFVEERVKLGKLKAGELVHGLMRFEVKEGVRREGKDFPDIPAEQFFPCFS